MYRYTVVVKVKPASNVKPVTISPIICTGSKINGQHVQFLFLSTDNFQRLKPHYHGRLSTRGWGGLFTLTFPKITVYLAHMSILILSYLTFNNSKYIPHANSDKIALYLDNK
jgi:hypothetical protein